MDEHPRIPDDAALLMAGIAVRRDVRDAAVALAGRTPQLGTAVRALGAALAQQLADEVGEDEEILYQHLLDVIAHAEAVAVRLRAAHPELRMRLAA